MLAKRSLGGADRGIDAGPASFRDTSGRNIVLRSIEFDEALGGDVCARDKGRGSKHGQNSKINDRSRADYQAKPSPHY
jgi:hypothetical protein